MVFFTWASILARKHCGSVHYMESRVKPLKPKNVEQSHVSAHTMRSMNLSRFLANNRA